MRLHLVAEYGGDKATANAWLRRRREQKMLRDITDQIECCVHVDECAVCLCSDDEAIREKCVKSQHEMWGCVFQGELEAQLGLKLLRNTLQNQRTKYGTLNPGMFKYFGRQPNATISNLIELHAGQ